MVSGEVKARMIEISKARLASLTGEVLTTPAALQGAGPRYPYPKEVWSPSGGWWTRPHNWVSNTVICAIGIGIASYGVWNYSADREWRHNAPTKQIPSMMWARQFKEGELSVKEP